MSDETLFHLALEKPAAERPAFLEQACAGDDALRRRVEALLRSHETPDSFLVRPGGEPRGDHRLRPQPDRQRRPPGSTGREIDRSDADRRTARAASSAPTSCCSRSAREAWAPSTWPSRPTPVHRMVALKLIKAGMDSRQVLARFGAERQALALMDHPNIARVFDAGTTEQGLPYFVMELVKGIPITRFCDEHRLTTARATRAGHPGLPGRAARPPEGDHPPRHQAVQRPDRPLRRQAGAQGHRLRRGQGDRSAADRPDALHRVRCGRRHARVHEPRAGRAEPARHRHPQRHLQPGRAPLRALDRLDSAGSQAAEAGGDSGNAAGDPRGGVAPAEHATLDDRGAADRSRRVATSSREN